MMVDTDYSQIKLIVIKELDQKARAVSLKELATYFEDKRKDGEPVYIITFNGKKFDLPIIIKQGLINKLDLPYWELKQACERYGKGSINHTDLMEVIGQYGDFKSLDKYMQIYLGIKKTPIDFMTCTDEELKEHCIDDVTNLEALYKLFNPIV